MKRILYTALIILSAVSSFAQTGNDTTKYVYYRYTYGNRLARYWANEVAEIPQDTTFSKYGIARRGSDFFIGNGAWWTKSATSIAAGYGLSGTTIFKVDTSFNGLISWKENKRKLDSLAAAIMAGSYVNPMDQVGDIIIGGTAGAQEALHGNTDDDPKVYTSKGSSGTATRPTLEPAIVYSPTNQQPGDHPIIGPDNKTWINQPDPGGCTRLLGPVTVSKVAPLTYYVSEVDYMIGCQPYHWSGGNVTLAAGDADPGEFRSDLIIFKTTGADTLKGENSVGDIGSVPVYDPATQIPITTIRIDEDNTDDTQVGQTIIWHEGYSSGDWYWTRTATIDSAYTGVTPYEGTYSMRLSGASNGQWFQLNSRFGALQSKSALGHLQFVVWNVSAVNANRTWTARLYRNGSVVPGSDAINVHQRGWTRGTTGVWLIVDIDLNDFHGEDSFNAIRFTDSNTGGTVNSIFDMFNFQTGIVVNNPVQQNGFQSITASIGNAITAASPNAVIKLRGSPTVNVKADGDSVLFSVQQLQADDRNFATDSIALYTFDKTKTLSTHGWTMGSIYAPDITTTTSSSGLTLAYAGSSSANSQATTAQAPWNSMSNEVTTEAEFTIVSFSSGATITIGGTNANPNAGTNVYVNLNITSGVIQLRGSPGSITEGTTTVGFAAGDRINFKLKQYIKYFTVEVTNLSTNKKESFSFENTHANGNSNIYPSFGQGGAASTIVLTKFNFYGNNYKPKLVVLSDSRMENDVFNNRDSIMTEVIKREGNITVLNSAKGFARVQDAINALPELRKYKGEYVLVDIGWNDVRFDVGGAWRANHQILVDSLLAMGYKVIVARTFPSTNSNPGTLNAFIDSTYTNRSDVTVLDLYATTDLYNGSNSPTFIRTTSYRDGDHPNAIGGTALGRYIVQHWSRQIMGNVESLTNLDFSTNDFSDTVFIMRKPNASGIGSNWEYITASDMHSIFGGTGGGGGGGWPLTGSFSLTGDVTGDLDGHSFHLADGNNAFHFDPGGFYVHFDDGSTLTDISSAEDQIELLSSDETGTVINKLNISQDGLLITLATGKVLAYAADYSADFTDRSLIDKGYFEAQTSSISTGTGAPGTTPGAVGDFYIDTSGKKLYVATGTSSSSDWTILN